MTGYCLLIPELLPRRPGLVYEQDAITAGPMMSSKVN